MCQTATATGVIEVFNANPKLAPVGRYPVAATPDPESEASETGTDLVDLQTKHAQWLLNRPANVGFRVVCTSCPGYESPYSIPLPATAAIDEYMGWVFHLQEKTWIGREDTMQMLYFWWRGRGLEIPHIHGPH